jgi:hypothetical protein
LAPWRFIDAWVFNAKTPRRKADPPSATFKLTTDHPMIGRPD